MTFRLASFDDYALIISLWEKAGLSHRPKGRDSQEKMKIEMERGIATFIIAEIQHVAVGIVLVSHDGRKGWINRLAVDPEYRKRGIASALIKEAEKTLLENGIEIFTCLIEDWNEASIALFKKAKYVEHKDIVYFSKRLNKDV